MRVRLSGNAVRMLHRLNGDCKEVVPLCDLATDLVCADPKCTKPLVLTREVTNSLAMLALFGREMLDCCNREAANGRYAEENR